MRQTSCPRVALLSLALLGCRTPAPGQPADPPPAAPPVAPPAEPTPAPPAEAPATCVPPLPAPPERPEAAGPAYVLVDDVGVLRIDDVGVTTLVPLADPGVAGGTELSVGPGGELWLSNWQGVFVLDGKGALRSVRKVRDGPRYEWLAARSPSDVWAVTSDIEWSLVRYDGRRWKPLRRRSQFRGEYDDNKLFAFALTSDAAWVLSANGLWRGAGDVWQKIELPASASADTLVDLWVYRDRPILGGVTGHYLREQDAWRPLAWPLDVSLNRALGEVGLVAAPLQDRAAARLHAIEGEGCVATSEAIPGRSLHALAVDASARTWAASDHALAVFDRSGRALATWTPGELPGLTDRVVDLAVIGAGPTRLPAPQPAPTWELVGELRIYKNHAPLAGAALELCSAIAGDRCAPGAFARQATTGADGSFRFTDVPEGHLSLAVNPAPGTEGCDGVFSVRGRRVVPARDCRAAPGAPRVCDLGQILQCLPFEMPPPPH